MNIPRELRYTKEHEWVRNEGPYALIGITDYAQHRLGSIVFIELPAQGKSVNQGETMATVDSVKAMAEIYAPLTGQVEAVNETLKDNPEIINHDPYGKGWMVKIKIDDPSQVKTLLGPEAYEAFIAEEEAKG